VAVWALDALALRHAPRDAFVEKYSRSSIMQVLAADIIRLLSPAPLEL